MKKIIILFLTVLILFYSCKKKSSPSSPSTPIGSTWNETTSGAAFGSRVGLSCLAYNSQMWVIGGYCSISSTTCNDVWYSPDGVNWGCTTTAAAFGPRSGHTSLFYNNEMWVIAGSNLYNGTGSGVWEPYNDIWSSTDGADWIIAAGNAAFTPRTGHTSVVFNNQMWVIGGTTGGNDTWYSIDGINWTCATNNAAFSKRAYHTSLVYSLGTTNYMWVIGGTNLNNNNNVDYNGNTNDVWYSADGINWTCATGAAAFSPRYQHTSVVYNGYMWVIAGYNSNSGGNPYNDVWYSPDGINWTEATGGAAFPTRMGHGSLIFNSKMWVIAGGYEAGYYNDVWYGQ